MLKQLLLLVGCLSILSNATTEAEIDSQSYSNFLEFHPQHIDLALVTRIEDKLVNGTVKHQFIALEDNVNYLFLDFGFNLSLEQIFFQKSNQSAIILNSNQYQLNTMGLSYQLQIQINQTGYQIKKGDTFYLIIAFHTSLSSNKYYMYQNETRSDWEYEYFYAMCNPFCREIFPLMDSLYLKSTVSISINHPNNFQFYIIGDFIESSPSYLPDYTIENYSLTQTIPPSGISFYGLTTSVKIHEASKVYIIASADLGEDVVEEIRMKAQNYIDAIETYLDIDLPFENLEIMLTPSTFPYFDTETADLSFVSSFILTGDGNETYNLARTVARQYFGSCVSASNWSNIWITEGLVAFMERKIIEIIDGKSHSDSNSAIGNNTLYREMLKYGMNDNLTTLSPQFKDNENPVDHFLIIAREKGYQLFKVIEQAMNSSTLTNPYSENITPLQQFLKDFITEFSYSDVQLDFIAFRNYWWNWLFNNMQNPQTVIVQVNFIAWVQRPGMPISKLNFNDVLQQQIESLAEEFLQMGGKQIPDDWHMLLEQTIEYYLIFLDYLIKNADRVSYSIYFQLDYLYNFSSSIDMRIVSVWYQLAIKSEQSKVTVVLNQIMAYLNQVGRLELIAPIYEAFNQTTQIYLGCSILRENSYWLHPIVLEYLKNLKCPETEAKIF